MIGADRIASGMVLVRTRKKINKNNEAISGESNNFLLQKPSKVGRILKRKEVGLGCGRTKLPITMQKRRNYNKEVFKKCRNEKKIT